MADKNFKVKNKLVIAGLTNSSGVLLSSGHEVDSHTNVPTQYGGTGTTQSPTAGQVLYSAAGSTYVPTTLSDLVSGSKYQADAPSSPTVGQIWIESDSNSDSFDHNIIRRHTFTATAGQTAFTASVAFINGYEQVYRNGLLLLKTVDYTVSSNITVNLTSASTAGDVIEILTVTNLNSVNTYTQAEVDALLEANTSVAPISISSNTNLSVKKRYFVTSASALTLTLPASPTVGDEVQVVDASGNSSTYNITIARNGKLINGNAGNFIIDVNGGWYTLLFTGNTYGWKVS